MSDQIGRMKICCQCQFEYRCLRREAFFLLSHKDDILADPRMAYAPVPILNGIAYAGYAPFEDPVLGVYLEWWAVCEQARPTDRDGTRGLVLHFSGSPITGNNRCRVVAEDGSEHDYTSAPFYPLWTSFRDINLRYRERTVGDAYCLAEVVGILESKTKGE